jgi:hypothetical protein
VGALEAALDLYFSRVWRLAEPRVHPATAVTLLGINLRRDQKVYTIEDVLEAGGIRAKAKAYATATDRADEFQDLYDAIDLRNIAVHSGVRVPVGKARPHVERIAKFVLDDIVPRIEAECPGLPRAELLYACEESLGNDCAPELGEIVATYLTGRGLTAKLYNQRYTRLEMSSERFGETLVIRVTFADFAPDAINLFIAQSLLFHYLERRGDIARARADYDPSAFAVARQPFFEVVAAAMTRVVWRAAVNQRLRALGFDRLVQQDAERRSKELGRKYRKLQSEPPFGQLAYWVDYLEVASVAAELPVAQRENLFRAVAATAPQTALYAHVATQGLERASFDDRESIREALIGVHDAHQGIVASAPIFDPVTEEWYGFGLRLEDFGIMSIGPVGAVDED